MSATDLAVLSATELMLHYRRRALSPVEVARACLERIGRWNDVVDAFCLVDEEGSLASARASEGRWLKGEPRGLVDGVPSTIKDLVLTRGCEQVLVAGEGQRDAVLHVEARVLARRLHRVDDLACQALAPELVVELEVERHGVRTRALHLVALKRLEHHGHVLRADLVILAVEVQPDAFAGPQPAGVERADGGTLLLDEISEMRLDLQAKLLRVLQEQEFERVGGTTPIRVDVRIVATTNRDLAAMVARGEFRQDLYYRLSVMPIVIAPLRERSADIPSLAYRFAMRAAAEVGKEVRGIAPDALELLQAHS